ncbi:MAG: protein phosphatase 2C domain-containing protein [Candidatus Vogelbacteria bacterium]|nr:protein phosphatase 2C domain-containing protein [Candidatus Vogelbacteria bacterium]
MLIFSATAPGSTHTNIGQPGKINNQDAIVIRQHGGGQVIVLCDGCGSMPYSGVGADIGANVIATAVLKKLERNKSLDSFGWSIVTKEVTNTLRGIIKSSFTENDSHEAFEQAVRERFLFTATVAITFGKLVSVASFGDCVVINDEDVYYADPPIPNSPPYIGYLLLDSSAYHAEDLKSWLTFNELGIIDLSKQTQGIIVGTDGLKDLANDDNLQHPLLGQPGGLRQWLNIVTTEKIDASGKLTSLSRCSDDVTLVVIRTEEAQTELEKSREPLAQFKQILDRLEKRLEGKKTSLIGAHLRKGERIVFRKELEKLKAKIAVATTDAGKFGMSKRLAERLKAMNQKVAEMYGRVNGMQREDESRSKFNIIATTDPIMGTGGVQVVGYTPPSAKSKSWRSILYDTFIGGGSDSDKTTSDEGDKVDEDKNDNENKDKEKS